MTSVAAVQLATAMTGSQTTAKIAASKESGKTDRISR